MSKAPVNVFSDLEIHHMATGEATQAEQNFDFNLFTSQQQDVLNFLRSL